MLEVAEIKTAIAELPKKDFVKLRQWISEKDWQKWEEQIKMDSDSGKLDFLIEEALEEKTKGRLGEL